MIMPDPVEHVYLSTSCFHGEHDYCASMLGVYGEKRPGTCKFCDAQCVCPCGHPAAPAVDESGGSVAEATVTDPHRVMLCWTPDQNEGVVSVWPSRVPVWSVVGLLRGGESVERVAGEFGLTVREVEVLVRLPSL